MAVKERSYLGLKVLVLSSLTFAVAMATVSSDYIRARQSNEMQSIERQLGESTLVKVSETAGRWYGALLANTDSAVFDMDAEAWKSDDLEQRKREEAFLESLPSFPKFNTWLHERAEAFLDLTYWVLCRLALFTIWLPLWLPLGILSIWHGYYSREIKKTDFGYASPVLNHWSRSAMGLLAYLAFVLLFVPVTIEPIVFPIMLVFWAIASSIAIGNIPKRI